MKKDNVVDISSAGNKYWLTDEVRMLVRTSAKKAGCTSKEWLRRAVIRQATIDAKAEKKFAEMDPELARLDKIEAEQKAVEEKYQRDKKLRRMGYDPDAAEDTVAVLEVVD